MKAAGLIAVAALMGLLAWRKGFNPLLWLLAGGAPGALVLLLMPTAKAVNLDDATRAKRRRTGNLVGAGITAAALVLAVVMALVMSRLTRRIESLEAAQKDVRSAAHLAEEAGQINKLLPIAVDSETEWTSVTGVEGALVRTYRLVKKAAAEVDADVFVATTRPKVTKEACGYNLTRVELIQGVTLRYSYTDRNGAPVASFDVTLRDCDK
jgi:hypothetical protein